MPDPRTNEILSRLSRVNRTGIFLFTLLIVLAALFTPGWTGVALIVVLAAAMIAMLALTWGAHAPEDRRRRVLLAAVLLAVMAFAAFRKVT